MTVAPQRSADARLPNSDSRLWRGEANPLLPDHRTPRLGPFFHETGPWLERHELQQWNRRVATHVRLRSWHFECGQIESRNRNKAAKSNSQTSMHRRGQRSDPSRLLVQSSRLLFQVLLWIAYSRSKDPPDIRRRLLCSSCNALSGASARRNSD